MEEQKSKLMDEELSRELKKEKYGSVGGSVLKILGILVVLVGGILGKSMPIVLLGAALTGMGEWIGRKSREKTHQQTYEALVPGAVGEIFQNVEFSPAEHLLNLQESNIPLIPHDDCIADGCIRGTYRGMPVELCTVVLTDTDEFFREETNMWERNERVVYTGQWMVCDLGHEFPAGMTFWHRGKLDKLLRSPTLSTGNPEFDSRFNLSCEDSHWAQEYLSPGRTEKILKQTQNAFGEVSVNLRRDGKLYLAVRSGRKFFDQGKGANEPEALRRRFSGELRWFAEMMDIMAE